MNKTAELTRRLAEDGARIFTVEQARKHGKALGVAGDYLLGMLHQLVKSGWLTRLRKGIYALPPWLTPTPMHEFEIAMQLVSPAAISHWTAMHHHGMTEQAPRITFVLTTTDSWVPLLRRGKKQAGYPVGGAIYQFVQVKPDRFFGIEKVWIGEAQINITDRERTLLDGLMMPHHCGGFTEALHAFDSTFDIDKTIQYALKLDAATVKRLGWVLEQRGVDPSKLRPLSEYPIKGYRILDPSGPRKGRCNRRWMIQENLPGMIA